MLLEAYKNKLLNETEIDKVIEQMIKKDFRISAEVLNEFWNIFEKIK